MKIRALTLTVCILGMLMACSKELPPRTVSEFLDDPILLDSAMVRCGQNRSSTKYDVECVNAREAISYIAITAETASREKREAQSERKRRALRRAQQAAADSRRNRAEADIRRQEAQYLGQFTEGQVVQDANGNALPSAVVSPDALPGQSIESGDPLSVEASQNQATSLESVREELERRQN
jgi:hypothetical protein